MARTSCNPVNLSYRFQERGVSATCCREAADPSLVRFQGDYWLFASKSGGFWRSRDLLSWEFIASTNLPVEDYAPDVRVIDNWLYFASSRKGVPGPIFRSRDPANDQWELVAEPFPFWDPNMFQDDDGRVYLYWGCSNREPILGVELDRKTMLPLGEPVALISQNQDKYGWERKSENNTVANPPHIEGAWMTKHAGRYYLQYAAPGTEFNVYGDGVYVGDTPLGPFVYAANNPVSYKPGGFITGAGHGSTFSDVDGNWWHISTMCVSLRHRFERRLGLFPAGFDRDGLMFCNARFADYPMRHPGGLWRNPMTEPFAGWMLLSRNKPVNASSALPGHPAELSVDENIRSYWAAGDQDDAWLEIDLTKECVVHAIQVNFAEHHCRQYKRPPAPLKHQYFIEYSRDGRQWFMLLDKSNNNRDVPHDYIELESGQPLRHMRLTINHMPAGGAPAICGLRVFGLAPGNPPAPVTGVHAERTDPLTAHVGWRASPGATGYNVLWGIAADKLYNCWQVLDDNRLVLPALTAGAGYYVAVEAFGEAGVAPVSEIIKT